MAQAAGVVLAGGQSARMGVAKAGLEWHGSTLVRRMAGLVARAVDGPVVVVRAAGQPLPPLPAGTEIADDARPGLGPVQGLAAGLAAVGDRARYAFVCATDMPLLHPVLIAAVLAAARSGPGADIALPVAHGYRQPFAAAYRTALAAEAERLAAAAGGGHGAAGVAGGQEVPPGGPGVLRMALLRENARVTELDAATLLGNPLLAALDPELDSLVSLNTPEDYAAAHARPAPLVTIREAGTTARPAGPPVRAPAATLAQAAAAAGWAGPVDAVLQGADGVQLRSADPELPLAAGDAVSLLRRRG